ncbi:MAG: SRPBCC family protein [Candidatus Dormibacteria bacterium]
MKVTATTIIDRPVERVFSFQADEHYRNHPRWDPAVTGLKPLGDGPIALGSRFDLTRRMMGREETSTFEVVVWDAPRTFVIATRSPGFSLQIAADCASAGDGRTRLTVSGDAKMGGVRGLLAPLMKGKLTRGAEANLARIKAMVEAES